MSRAQSGNRPAARQGNGRSAREAPRIGFVTLGCPKNLVDSETMLGGLHRAGFAITSDLEEASLVVVNTCAFLTASQQESIDTILRVAQLKKTARLRKLVVTGCLPQRHGPSVLEELPEVDYLLGPGTLGEIADVARGLLADRLAPGARLGGLDGLEVEWEPRVISGHRHAAYLKISEGCNHTCTFCIIPRLRGRHRSRPMEEIEREAARMAAGGVGEITLVAQDSTAYGRDLYGKACLPELLARLDAVEGLRWIRVLYAYPSGLDERFLAALRDLPRVVPYLDIPVQHTSAAVLRRMRRPHRWSKTEAWLSRLRREVPGMVLRTTIITGFPGETEGDYEELLRATGDFEFDHLGVFAYSTEEGTPAARMPEAVPEELREQRRERLMLQQRAITLRRNRGRIGRRLEVLVDSVDPGTGLARGRWSGQALEIDGGVIISAPDPDSGARPPVSPGKYVGVRVRGAGPYDLVGSVEEGQCP